MRTVSRIILHCSDSLWGDRRVIDEWHKQRQTASGEFWEGIGYHYVIGNGYPTAERHKEGKPVLELDGHLEVGRHLYEVGAHCRGHNHDSIGVCLIGVNQFTGLQIERLETLVIELSQQYENLEIFGHYEFDKAKTCPNLDMNYMRELLSCG